MAKLQEWLTRNKERQDQEVNIPDKYFGEYHIFYRTWPYLPELQKDIIILNREGVEYYHEPDPKKPIKWQGEAVCNYTTKTLTINLHGPVDEKQSQKKRMDRKDKPVFVMLSIPSEETDVFDTLIGVAAGVRDNDGGVVARLVIAVKLQNDKYPKQYSQDELEDFITAYAERSWVRPPAKTPVFKFKDLKRALAEGLQHRQDAAESIRSSLKGS